MIFTHLPLALYFSLLLALLLMACEMIRSAATSSNFTMKITRAKSHLMNEFIRERKPKISSKEKTVRYHRDEAIQIDLIVYRSQNY